MIQKQKNEGKTEKIENQEIVLNGQVIKLTENITIISLRTNIFPYAIIHYSLITNKRINHNFDDKIFRY